jgi:hypothetical protein
LEKLVICFFYSKTHFQPKTPKKKPKLFDKLVNDLKKQQQKNKPHKKPSSFLILFRQFQGTKTSK